MSAFGPQNANASSTLPSGVNQQRYVGDTWVKDASAPGASDGTVVDAAWYNRIIGALDYIIAEAGLTPAPGDFSALYKAILAVAPNSPQFARVASSGNYGDLNNAPILGTAAQLNWGTAGNNAVKLDGAGRMPIVDGSQMVGLSFGGRRAIAAADIVIASDKGKLLVCTGTFTLAFTPVATLGASFFTSFRNDGTGIITLQPNGTDQIDNGSSVKLYPGETCVAYSDGVNLKTQGLTKGRILVGQQTITAAASVTFDSVFTTDFASYEIELRTMSISAASTSLQAAFRRAGVTLAAAGYNYGSAYTNTSASAFDQGSGSATSGYIIGGLTNSSASSFESTLIGRNLAVANGFVKHFRTDSWQNNPSSARYVGVLSYAGDVLPIDGISFFPASGTISGTVAIYGQRG